MWGNLSGGLTGAKPATKQAGVDTQKWHEKFVDVFGTPEDNIKYGPVGAPAKQWMEARMRQQARDRPKPPPSRPESLEEIPPGLLTGFQNEDVPFLDKSGYNKFRSFAYDPRQTDWLKTALGREDVERGRLFDKLGMTAQSSAATGMGNLAATGGLTGGAAERLQRQAGRDRMMGTADVSRQSLSNRLGLVGAEQQAKISAMGRIPELDISMYEAEMKPIAAEKLAEAIKDSQPGQKDDALTKFWKSLEAQPGYWRELVSD
jgi:hypothetical protein